MLCCVSQFLLLLRKQGIKCKQYYIPDSLKGTYFGKPFLLRCTVLHLILGISKSHQLNFCLEIQSDI